MGFPMLGRAALPVVAAFTALLLGTALPAQAQPAWPTPGTSNHDTDGMGGNDLQIHRIDTDADGVADKVHIDSNSNGVVDPGERVVNNVTSLVVIGGAAGATITITEDTGTEKVKTTLELYDFNHDGDCSDDKEMIQRNSMPDSVAQVQMSMLGQLPIQARLQGSAEFAANLNNIIIVPPPGFEAIPIEIVALSLTGGPQPIVVGLQPSPPSPGRLFETLNAQPGSLEGRLFTAGGTIDSFFDVFATFDFQGRRLVSQGPLRLESLGGQYPPRPGQAFHLVAPVLLIDTATGQPAGTLDRFDWIAHAAPRLDCDCDKMSITPIIRTEGKKGQEVVKSPVASGAVNAGNDMVYDVEIEVEWALSIQCKGDGVKCEGTYFPTAVSEGWMIDGKKSAPMGPEAHDGAGATGNVDCTGECDGLPRSIAPAPTTTYKVSVKKGAGGIITHKVSGLITLRMNPFGCAGNAWKMVLLYEADLKKGEVRIDPLLSNWDGDKKINAADKNPLDPTKN